MSMLEPIVVISSCICRPIEASLEPDSVPVALLGGVEGHLLAAHRDDLAGRALQCLGARVTERGDLRTEPPSLPLLFIDILNENGVW